MGLPPNLTTINTQFHTWGVRKETPSRKYIYTKSTWMYQSIGKHMGGGQKWETLLNERVRKFKHRISRRDSESAPIAS